MRADWLAERFEAVYGSEDRDLKARYNIAPTQQVRATDSRRTILLDALRADSLPGRHISPRHKSTIPSGSTRLRFVFGST